MTVDILEVQSICDSMEVRNWELFEQLGVWLSSDDPPRGALGRLVVEACHRHASHGELWADRRPVIPVTVPARSPERGVGSIATYRAAVDDLRARLQALAARVDRELDPSTHRVIDLVSCDLAAIADRL